MEGTDPHPGEALGVGAAPNDALSSAIESLARLTAAARLYGSDHAAVRSAAAATVELFRAVDAGAWPLMLAVVAGGFSHNGERLICGPASDELAAALCDSGVAAVEWLRVPSDADMTTISAWAGGLSGARAAALPQCAEGPSACVRVVRVGGSALRFVEGDSGDSAKHGADWEALCQALASGAAGDGARAAAADVRERLERCGPEDRESAAELLLAARDTGAVRSQRSRRAVEALARLSPELRRSLLAVCATGNAEWVAEQSENLPVEDLVESLRAIDVRGHVPPPATLLLLKKLVGLTRLTASVRGSLSSLVAKWGGENEPFGELMVGHGADVSCPEDYRVNLRHAAETVRTSSAAVTAREAEEFHDDAVAARTCELAVDMLAAAEGDGNTQLFETLVRLLPRVANAGRAEVVLAAFTVLARAAAGSDGTTPGAGNAVVAQAMGHTLRGLGTDEASISMLARLTSVAPVPVVSAIADRLAAREIMPDHAHARCVGALASPAVMREAATTALSGGTAGCAGVALLLGACAGETSLVGAEPLLASDDSALRALVLRTLDGCAAVWPPRVLHLALTHPEPSVVEIGRARLLCDPGACNPDLLGSLLDGSLTGSIPDERTAIIVASALVARGGDGIDRAAAVLSELTRGVRLRRIEVCRALARALAPHAARPAAAGALKAWRRSAGGMVSWLFADQSARRAA